MRSGGSVSSFCLVLILAVSCGNVGDDGNGGTDAGSCTPDCSGKVCGALDGCGGKCTWCPDNATCDANMWVCVCPGVTCGWSCCLPGETCGPNETCIDQVCVQQCVGKECGDDGCGGSCGSCGSGMTCNALGKCEACQSDCTNKECGDDGCGGSCGSCPAAKKCEAGTCVPSVGPGSLGTYCGATAECPATIIDSWSGLVEPNPLFTECMNAQCDSNACLNGGIPEVYLGVPACTIPCQITIDEINNKTKLPGADGIEDPDVLFTDCYGFADGPGGDHYVCVEFAPLNSGNSLQYCVPGTTFHYCDSDADCIAGEQCTFTSIGGEYAERCIARVQATAEVSTAKMSETCDESGENGPVTFCESGLCFGMGCVSYCSDDVDCDTTKLFPGTGCDTASGFCKTWPSRPCTQDSDCSLWECGMLGYQLFSDYPWYTADLCWPKTGCQGDDECPEGYYCDRDWAGKTDPLTGLPLWSNFCVAQFEGGVNLGGECSEEGPVCTNDDLCVGGHCSALCEEDGDCGNSQLCTVNEFTVDLNGNGDIDQSLPLEWCTTHEGSKTPCFSKSDCGVGEHCDIVEIENKIDDPVNPGQTVLDPDGPYLETGLCVTSDTGLAGLAEPCLYGSDCGSGWCLNSDPDTGSQGFCSNLCETADDCDSISSGGSTYKGICVGTLVGWGGNTNILETNLYAGSCYFTLGSGTDCSSTLSCDSGEICIAYPISFGPDYPAHVDYRCIPWDNADGSAPTVDVGGACDPWAEDAEGNPLNQCLSGYCVEGAQIGTGYCGALCKPGSVECSHPSQKCMARTTIPRKGKYQGNSGTWYLCQQDI